MIFSLGLRLFRNEEDALDFVQDIYLDAYQKRDRFEGRSRYSTFIYSFALHRGLSQIRKSRRVQFESVEGDLPAAGETEAPDAPPELVRDELNALPEVYRLPLVLHYYERMSIAEIAHELGQKENTVKSYMLRGRRILKEKIEKRLEKQ